MATHFFNIKPHYSRNQINLHNVDEKRYKYGNLLIFACFFLYASSMAAKGVFAAEMEYITNLWGLEYAKASMANTFYFVTYGLVQIGLFFFMNKISMRKYMIWTIPVAAITTALIGLSTKIEHIWIYFGISGAFQAGIYCGCNLMLSKYLPVKLMTRANTVMNLGYAVGTVVAYLLSAYFVKFDAWRVPYFIIGGIFLVSIIVFAIVVLIAKKFVKINDILDKKLIRKSDKKDAENLDDSDPIIGIKTRKKLIVFYIVDLVMVFLITALYYCVMNYITSLLVKVHGLSSDVSIYVSIVAPIAIAIGPIMTINACNKGKDFIRKGILFTALLTPIPLLLIFFYDLSGTLGMLFALLLSVIFVVIANGIKTISLGVMTFKMRKVINAGSYSAISNAVASVSAGVTPTIIGAIIDVCGWEASYLCTFILCLVVLFAMILIDLVVRRDYRKEHNLSSQSEI